MKDNIIDEELKNLLITNDEIVHYSIISLLNSVYKERRKQKGVNERDFFISDFDSYNTFINDNESLKVSLTDTFKENISNTMINEIANDYMDLALTEAKGVIYSLSRLLFIQDKFKDSELGQDIDNKIKEYIKNIKGFKRKEVYDTLKKGANENKEEYIQATKKLEAYILYTLLLKTNLFIYTCTDEKRDFVELFINPKDENFKFKPNESRTFIRNYLSLYVSNALEFKQNSDKINSYINDLLLTYNNDDFFSKYSDEIAKLKEKYNITDEMLTDETFLSFIDDDNFLDSTKEKKANTKINNYYDELYELSQKYEESEEKYKIDYNNDVKKWRDKADILIKYLSTYNDKIINDIFNINYNFDFNMLVDYLSYNDYQKQTYKLELQEKKAINIQRFSDKVKDINDNVFMQATSKQFKAIDNARGGLVTYTETNTQAIKNELKEKQDILKNTYIKEDKEKIQKEIIKLQSDLKIAEKKESELKTEYDEICVQLKNIYNTMEGISKTTDYYKELKRRKREQEQRKKEIEKIIDFNGWNIDIWGNGKYELILNDRQKEKLILSIENLSKQVAKYTKEEQDMFDFLVNKHLHNTGKEVVTFSLREYEKLKNRVRPTNYLVNDIQALRLLLREIWTYYNKDDTKFIFTEQHLFDNLTIKGEIEKDINNLDTISLDTQISIEPTETLKTLLKDHENYLYIKTTSDVMQLNNDNEYLAKRLLKYLRYLARVNHESTIEVSLDKIIEELQHYGLKKFNQLGKHKTYKTEIVDNLDKYLSILEGDNHINKRFIEVLDRQPFINYDNEYRGKSQEKSINEWGKHKVKIKMFDLDDESLKVTKKKQNDNKKKKSN